MKSMANMTKDEAEARAAVRLALAEMARAAKRLGVARELLKRTEDHRRCDAASRAGDDDVVGALWYLAGSCHEAVGSLQEHIRNLRSDLRFTPEQAARLEAKERQKNAARPEQAVPVA